MEAFYDSNRIIFLLFYERALISQNNYKGSIIRGFNEVCEEMRWSRVACGMVDMVEDRAYGQRYIDPKTAPAHIVVRDGEPVLTQKPHVEKLMAKPGDKATMLWHLRDLLTPHDATALDISFVIDSEKRFSALLGQHTIVVAALFDSSSSGSREKRETFRAEAQSIVLSGKVNATVDGLPWLADSTGKKKQAKERRAQVKRARVVFAAVMDAAALKKFPQLSGGKPAAWVNGEHVSLDATDLESVAQGALLMARKKQHVEL
jgi:hypothetical protein